MDINTKFKYVIIFSWFVFSSSLVGCKAQKNSYKLSDNKKIEIRQLSAMTQEDAERISRTGDAYQLTKLRAYLDANNSIIEIFNDSQDIDRQLRLIENVINTAIKSKDIKNNKSKYNDDFRSWISLNRDKVFQNEVPLYESYSFFYIAKFLYLTKNNGWSQLNKQNHDRWYNVLHFVEKNIWTKWYTRCKNVKGNHYWYFLRGRTHMGAHWSGFAMYLNGLTKDLELKKQTKQLTDQYDMLLKRNFKIRDNSYIWNSTYDDVQGTYASASKESIIQDVSHGNHVIAYIVAAYDYGNSNWKNVDIIRLCNTLKNNIYNRDNNSFKDNVDGSMDKNSRGRGNYISDGWVKLGKYDSDVQKILYEFGNTNLSKKRNPELQYRANLLEY